MKNQRKFLAFLYFIVLSPLLFCHSSYAAGDSSCVTCHTNESLMKSLYKPPLMTEGESGEG